MTDKPIIGFIGVGLMGHGMAANILKGGYTLYIKGNRNREPIDDLVAKGAIEVGTPKEMAALCDVIHICLPNSDFVEATIRGHDGILAGGKAELIVIDSSTANPTSTVILAQELKERGMHMVDAPLGRTPKEAEAGMLDAMVGADDAIYAKVLPIIDCWAGIINHVGPVGSAHKMKLIMNFISMGYAAIYAEALSVGVKSGLTPQTIQDVIGASRLSNGFFDTFMSCAVGRDMEAHKFSITNASKDVHYVSAMASNARALNPVGEAVKSYYTYVEAQGCGADNVPQLADHVAKMNGFDLAEAVKKGAK
ncbi:MAG: 3-hydroxyisobutyrate dehydrogenase-like beta-hydroxyacid dehydrogenase [Celeribacter sp.]|jgi:3-hydroxyisobutyrate dehydrogenase-like beta-hydroxyacid dehydrogenase